MTARSRAAIAAPIALIVAAVITGCSATPNTQGATATDAPAFPLTIDNCGSSLTLTAAPQRILLVNNDSVANLETLGAIDRVVAVTSPLDPGLYDDDTYARLGALPALSTETTSTGGSVVSQESIIGESPDLVIAPENAVDREQLAASGIAVYSPTAYCTTPGPELSERASFDRVYAELRDYGRMLGTPDKAEEAIDSAARTIAALDAPDAGTAAALYVSSGGAVLSPYGGPSMVTPVFEAAGLRNVYADSEERVFDASVEDIIAKDPGTIVLLYSGDDPQSSVDAFLAAPGVNGLAAVRNDRVLTLRFPYTDPPSTLSARGPGVLADTVAALR